MQNKIRAWSSLLLSAIFFTSVLMEYIPTPQDIIEFTFLANFGIGVLLLLTGIQLFRQKKAFADILYHIGLAMILLVFIICLIGLSGIYQIHFEGEFFFLHVINPLLFLLYNVAFVRKITSWNVLFLIPLPVVLYLFFDLIYGTIRGKFIYNLLETGKLTLIKIAAAFILCYAFTFLEGLFSLLLHRFLKDFHTRLYEKMQQR